EPEIELRGFRKAEARADSAPDAAHDALESDVAAKRIEIRRALEQARGPRLEMVGGFEGRERVVAPAEREQVPRALDLEHRLRRVGGAGALERLERMLVQAELALGLRDAQPAQPIVRRFGDELSIAFDRLLPPSLLECEVRGMRERLGLRKCRPGEEPRRERRENRAESDRPCHRRASVLRVSSGSGRDPASSARRIATATMAQ